MNAQCHACIGGTNVREDMARLQNGVHIVVGTPGRVFDMINRQALGWLLLLYYTRHIVFCLISGGCSLKGIS